MLLLFDELGEEWQGGQRGRRQEVCRQDTQLQGSMSRSIQVLRPMSLSETVLLRACSGKKWENALGQTAGVVDGEGEEEADQEEEEEVGGVWLVGSVDELRDGWRRSEATDARRLMQTEIDPVQQIWCRSRRRTHLN